MYKYRIVNLPPCRDWQDNFYPKRYGLTLIDNLGHHWDGGEFLNIDDAIQHAKAMGYERAN